MTAFRKTLSLGLVLASVFAGTVAHAEEYDYQGWVEDQNAKNLQHEMSRQSEDDRADSGSDYLGATIVGLIIGSYLLSNSSSSHQPY